MWSRLAKGVIGTDHVDAQLGDGLPAEVVLGLTTAEIADCDRAAAIVLLGPDLKEELPVLLPPRPAGRARAGRSDRRPRARRPMASRSTRPRPCARCPASRSARTRSHESRAYGTVAPVPSSSSSAAVRSRSRPTRPCARPLRSPPCPTCASSPALRRGNVHGALGAGLAPGFLPGRVALDDGREWFTEHWGAAPPDRGLDATGILARRGRRQDPGARAARRRSPRRLPRRGPRQARRSTVPAS